MNNCIVGILPNILFERDGYFPGQERVYVNAAYVRAIEDAGGTPIVIPNIISKEQITAQINQLDGLLLSGGDDVSPLYYGEEPLRGLGIVHPDMDKHQLTAARICHELGKPMLGICRGLQIMNVAFGGTLYQNIYSRQAKSNDDNELNEVIEHVQKAQRHVATHTVEIRSNTTLARIFTDKSILTNSFHHQAVKQVAPEFVINAVSKDGIVEGIEKPGDIFTVGVQWHPEAMYKYHDNMAKFFKKFVKCCYSGKKS